MPAPAIGHIVECKQCHTTTVVTRGEHVHDALKCACCPGHSSEHSDAGQDCRPVIIHANAVASMVDLNGAGN
jgi:hypothetical protein